MPRFGGCTFVEAPDRPAPAGAVFWRADAYPAILPVEAFPAPEDHEDAIAIHELGHDVIALKRGERIEHVLLVAGAHRIQLEVTGASLFEGPVRLRYDLAGFDGVEPKVATLQRLIALRRLGRFPRALFPPEPRARRLLMALRAHDGRQAGANPRDIAAALFGRDVECRDWYGPSDYLRSRVRRAIAAGEHLINGGYLELLKP